MEKLSILLIVFAIGGDVVVAQIKTVQYLPTDDVINNPERGFYLHTETHSASYVSLNILDLKSYVKNNFTLILRVFYLENFVSSNISSSYLSAMQNDFNIIRNAGLKAIVRFAYSDDSKVANLDASKSRILSHLTQLAPLLKNNVDIIAFFQAGFIGTWGEWYYTNNFGDSSNPTPTDYANRKQVTEAILSALPNTRMVQVRTPTLKKKMYGTTTSLAQSQAFTGTSLSRLGQHNDCFLASIDDFGTYQDVSKEYPWLQQETRFVPMGGESCGVDSKRTTCPIALNEMKIFHWTFMNYDYHPAVINIFKTKNCFSTISKSLGYRFQLINGTYPLNAKAGTSFSIVFTVVNNGFASVYNKRIVYLVLRNIITNNEYSFALATDPRRWESSVIQKITETISLPSNILAGTYSLFLNLPDSSSSISSRSIYSIRFANGGGIFEEKTGYNNLFASMIIK